MNYKLEIHVFFTRILTDVSMMNILRRKRGDTLSKLVMWCYHLQVIVMDGKTGETLWSLQTDRHEMTSDLVARTTAPHRDAFIFRVQGRLDKDTTLSSSTKDRTRREADPQTMVN